MAKTCNNCGYTNGPEVQFCARCNQYLVPPLPPVVAQQIAPAPPYQMPQSMIGIYGGYQPCGRCGGPLMYQEKSENQGSGCIVAVLGLLFAPVLIGIPILIYGFVMMSKKKKYYHCSQCGTQFPFF